MNKNISICGSDCSKCYCFESKMCNGCNEHKGVVFHCNGKECAISYVYQTRYCEEKDVDEERYIYYAFFEKDGQEYLVQFTSNYTLPGSNKTAFGVTGNTQEECKKAFESILMDVFIK